MALGSQVEGVSWGKRKNEKRVERSSERRKGTSDDDVQRRRGGIAVQRGLGPRADSGPTTEETGRTEGLSTGSRGGGGQGALVA